MSEFFRKPIVKTLMLKGQEGQSIKGIKKTGTDVLVDTYTITLTDGTTSTFTVTNGKGISSLEKTETHGLVDTYTIKFNDGTNSTFTVTNGKEILSIDKTGTDLLVDTYTIEFNDGTTSTFTVTNGKGISNISKTETSGLVDTYTIEFNDGTTSTFTVTNGDSAYKPAVEALGKRIDNLILSSGTESSAEVVDARTGYDGTAHDTLGTAIRSQISELKGDIGDLRSEAKQTTNLLYLEDATLTKNGITVTIKDGYITLQGKSTTNLHIKVSNELTIGEIPEEWVNEHIEGFKSGDTLSAFYVLKNGINLPTAIRIYNGGMNDYLNITDSVSYLVLDRDELFTDIYCANGCTVDCMIGIQLENGDSTGEFIPCNKKIGFLNPNIKSERMDSMERNLLNLNKEINDMIVKYPQDINLLYVENAQPVTKNGVTVSIEDGIINLYGKSNTNLHIKISNGVVSTTDITGFFSEQVSDLSSGELISSFFKVLRGEVFPTKIRCYGSNTITYFDITEEHVSKELEDKISFVDIYLANGKSVDCSLGIQIQKGDNYSDFIPCTSEMNALNPNVKIEKLDEITSLLDDLNKEMSIVSEKCKSIPKIINVSKNGNSQYSLIQSAIDDASDGDTVMVASGEYEEHLDLGNKRIRLIGANPLDTIVFDTSGEYSKAPIICGNGYISGFTFWSKRLDKEYTFEESMRSYAMHLDQRWGRNRKIQIDNCIFISDFSTAIGCGLIDDCHILITNCRIVATGNSGNGLQVHGSSDGHGNAVLDIRNCIIDSNGEYSHGIFLTNGSPEANIGTTITIKAHCNKTEFYNYCGDLFILDRSSWGNSDAQLNFQN